MTALYSSVPKTIEANLQYRQGLMRRAKNDPSLQAELRSACKEDILFWINSFCWLSEQRKKTQNVLPFLTFDYQDDMIVRMDHSLGDKNIVGDKSRDCGFTWAVIYEFLHRCQFFTGQSFAVASRNDALVETPGSPDCLYWKFDFALSQQPSWLTGKKGKDYIRTKKHLLWPDLGNDITGYATTKDIARGGRRLAILLDELAAYDFKDGMGAWVACTFATDCIVAVSTQQGTVGAFAEACGMAKLKPELYEYFFVRWWMDPRKNANLEWRKEGSQSIKDKNKPVPALEMIERGYRAWSPWWEIQFDRLFRNQRRMAEEVDGNQSAAGSGFFDESAVAEARQYCRMPLKKGRLLYDDDTCEPLRFIEDADGPLELWTIPGSDGRPPLDDYANGVDISAGVGATPSTMAIVSKRTGEKYGQFGFDRLKPSAFAKYAIAVSKWFHNAQLIWEAPGPGGEFTATIRLVGYRNLYYRRTNEGGLVPEVTDQLGWVPLGNKRRVFESFRDALGNEYLERSFTVLKECESYRYAEDGDNIEQAKAKKSDDPKASGQNHGDYVTASVLAWLLVKESRMYVGKKAPVEPTRRAPPYSIAWMIEEEGKAQENQNFMGGLRL